MDIGAGFILTLGMDDMTPVYQYLAPHFRGSLGFDESKKKEDQRLVLASSWISPLDVVDACLLRWRWRVGGLWCKKGARLWMGPPGT